MLICCRKGKLVQGVLWMLAAVTLMVILCLALGCKAQPGASGTPPTPPPGPTATTKATQAPEHKHGAEAAKKPSAGIEAIATALQSQSSRTRSRAWARSLS